MYSSDSDSAVPTRPLVRCICTRKCGGPGGGGKLISMRSRQRHALREPKELPPSFAALWMQPSNAPPAAGAVASGMGPVAGKPHIDSAMNVDLINRDHVGAGGSLREDGEGVLDDVVCCAVAISNDLSLFHIGYAQS